MSAKTYDRHTGKFLAKVAENMPEMSSDVMQGWIQNPKSLQRFLEGLCPPIKFLTWKTIKLGTGLKTADDFRGAIKQARMKIGNLGNDIIGKPAFTASNVEAEVDLINVSVAELGFKDGATRKEIYERAIQLDLELCPAEVGPQLRLQYKDQPKGEWLLIGMEPITASDGNLHVFLVGHDGDGRWLRGYSGHPDGFWFSRHRFVFVRRK